MKLYSADDDKILNTLSPVPSGSAYSRESVFINTKPELDFSVIVPCYNSQKYLGQCLESIIGQKTHYSYEIIAVNDGSEDNTGDILDRFAEKSNCLRIITQENRGFSGARNRGIRESKGKYLMFVDSDDYISGGFFEELMNAAYSVNADIAACGFRTFSDKGVYKKVCAKSSSDRSLLNGCFWGKVFKREIFEHIILPEGYWFEDSILAHLIYPVIKEYSSTNKCFYGYRSNPEGITFSARGNVKSLDTLYITDLMIRSAEGLYGTEYISNASYYELLIAQFYLNQRRLTKLSEEYRYEVFRLQSEFVNKYYKGYKTKQLERKIYEQALRSRNYRKSETAVRLDKLYKLINIFILKLK